MPWRGTPSNAMEDARGRRAELQTEMDGMTSRLDVLAEDVRLREEELASLRGNVEFARTEKEEGHVEYEEIGIRLVRGREKLSRFTREASRLERETAEASRALEEARGVAREDFGGGVIVRGTVRGGGEGKDGEGRGGIGEGARGAGSGEEGSRVPRGGARRGVGRKGRAGAGHSG